MKPIAHVWRITAFVALALLLTAPVFAQGFKWWNSDRYRRELGLTSEQSKRLEEIFQAALPNLRTHKKALDAAEADFDRLVERADDNAVMEQVGRVEAARSELNKARTMMLLKMRRALTTDQWVKLGALHQADERERHAHEAERDAARERGTSK